MALRRFLGTAGPGNPTVGPHLMIVTMATIYPVVIRALIIAKIKQSENDQTITLDKAARAR